MERDWVNTQLHRLLDEGFLTVTDQQWHVQTHTARDRLEITISKALNSGVINQKEAAYISHRFQQRRSGTFRLRVKLHKTPMAARPIANMTASWLQPACIFIVEKLGPLCNKQPHIAVSSTDFLAKNGINCLILPGNYVIVTIDAKNLYPSIDQNHLMTIISRRLRREKGLSYSMCSFLINLIDVTLRSQHVQHGGIQYLCVHGIATGSAAGVVLANYYLSEFDTDMQWESLRWYARFVDDCCLAIPEDEQQSQLARMNGWNSHVQWEITASGRTSVPFLDLAMSIESSGAVSYETYRKARNAYLYIPATSAHPPNVYKAIILGELQRLRRTNSAEPSYRKHVRIFEEKLRDRGWCKSMISRTISRFNSKEARPVPAAPTKRCRRFYFKTTWTSTLRPGQIRSALNKHAHLLSALTGDLPVGLAFRTQRSIFRRFYGTNWR